MHPGQDPTPPPEPPAQRDNGITWLIVIISVAALLLVAAVVVVPLVIVAIMVGPTVGQQISSTTQAHATETAAPAATAIAASTQSAQAELPADARLTFIETFNDNKRDWRDGVDTEAPATTKGFVRDGQYTLSVTGDIETYFWWSIPAGGWIPASFYLSVDAMQITGEPDSSYGLLFNYSYYDDDWAFFQIAETGYFRVMRSQDGDISPLTYWTKLDAIRSDGWNRLAIRSQDEHYQFFVNNALAFETDKIGKAAWKSGLVVVGADATEQAFQFDNFTIYTLEN